MRTAGAPVRYFGGRGRSRSEPIQLPFLSLSPDVLEQVSPAQYANADDEEVDFDYESDPNFWRCLNAFAKVTPAALTPPLFNVAKGGEELVVSRKFLFKFIAAWHAQFPMRIVVTRVGSVFGADQPESTVFYAHPPVWTEIEGRSLPAQGNAVPRAMMGPNVEFYFVQHADDTTPRIITAEAFADMAAIWPDQSVQRGAVARANQARPRAAVQPTVRIPKQAPANKHRRPPGAPPSSRDQKPTIRLCIQSSVYDTTVHEQSPLRKPPAVRPPVPKGPMPSATTVPLPQRGAAEAPVRPRPTTTLRSRMRESPPEIAIAPPSPPISAHPAAAHLAEPQDMLGNTVSTNPPSHAEHHAIPSMYNVSGPRGRMNSQSPDRLASPKSDAGLSCCDSLPGATPSALGVEDL